MPENSSVSTESSQNALRTVQDVHIIAASSHFTQQRAQSLPGR